MSEVIAALVGVIVGGGLGYVIDGRQRRAERRADAYIAALATLQTARDAYARAAGVVGRSRAVEVAPDHDLNLVAARLQHDGSAEVVNAYEQALRSAFGVHEVMMRPVREAGDQAALDQHAAVEAFSATVGRFADVAMPRRSRPRR